MTRKKHINKFLAPTQSRDNPANLFMFMCFFFPRFLPLIHGLCAFSRPLLTPVSTAPSLPASQFTVCTSRFARPRTKFFDDPSGHGRQRRKSWTFSCGPGDGEKLFDPWASGRKGQERAREIRTNKILCICCFFFPDKILLNN